MAFRIFPEDERVTDLLVQMSRCVVTAVEQLSEHVGQVDKVWEQPLTDLLETAETLLAASGASLSLKAHRDHAELEDGEL